MTNTQKYQRLVSYDTPLCSGKATNEIIYDSVNPVDNGHPHMCRLNNECKTTEHQIILNQRGVKPSPWFERGKDNEEHSIKQDARLVDTTRNYTQKLDIKPIQVYYDLINDNISENPNLTNYGKKYTDYESVTGGQIQYYIDKQFREPFHTPVYAYPTRSLGYVWTDPMSAVKPQFEKSYPDPKATMKESCLSSIQDTCSHRDDIIARQQRKHNEQNFSLVYQRM